MRWSDRLQHLLRAGLALALVTGLPAPAQGKSQDKGRQGVSGRESGTAGKGIKAGGRMNTPERLLDKNPKLSSRLQELLPLGTDLQLAAAGFKNLGQFVAALHVSRNLGIPFDQLKAQMLDNTLSLGAAIQVLKPTVDAEEEADIGEDQADEELQAVGS